MLTSYIAGMHGEVYVKKKKKKEATKQLTSIHYVNTVADFGSRQFFQ